MISLLNNVVCSCRSVAVVKMETSPSQLYMTGEIQICSYDEWRPILMSPKKIRISEQFCTISNTSWIEKIWYIDQKIPNAIMVNKDIWPECMIATKVTYILPPSFREIPFPIVETVLMFLKRWSLLRNKP